MRIIKPKYSIYSDTSKDAVGGELEMCDINDYVDALEKYYTNRDLILKHGAQSRKDIIENYTWSEKARHFRTIILEATKDLFPEKEDSIDVMSEINSLINTTDDDLDNIDIDKLIENKIASNNQLQLKITEEKLVKQSDLDKLSKDDLKTLQEKIHKLLNA
jgi:hypothetical protein